jgi:starch synthase
MHILSPASDTAIPHRYTVKSLEQKLQNKIALQEKFGWPDEAKRPMVCLPAGMTNELGGALFLDLLPGLLSLPIELLVLGKGSSQYGSLFTQLAKTHSHRIAIIPTTEEAERTMFAAADIALFLSDPSGMPQLKHALAYGAVPVAPEIDELENYNPNQESGNSFLFEAPSPWLAFGAVVRALETYKFPFDWRTIQKHGMANS